MIATTPHSINLWASGLVVGWLGWIGAGLPLKINQTWAVTRSASSAELAVATESLLILRDLTVYSPVVVRDLGPDGVILSDDTRIPWHEVLVAQNWTLMGADAPLPLMETQLQNHLHDFGQDWFLVLSRLRRGESYQVPELLTRLQDRYHSLDQPTAGSIAASLLLSQHLANQGRPMAAAATWFAAQHQLQQSRRDPQQEQVVERWLSHYVNPADLPVDLTLGLPLHAPPIPAVIGTAEPQLPPFPTALPEALIYQVVAAVHVADMTSLPPLLDRLNASLPEWNPSLHPLVRSLIETIITLQQWHANPEQAKEDSVRFGYLESERQWQATLPPTTTQTTGMPMSSGNGEASHAIARSQIAWQVYLQGLYLLRQTDPQLKQSGRVRLRLLDYWSQQSASHRQENALLSTQLRRLLSPQ
jgi:hypothetical protein